MTEYMVFPVVPCDSPEVTCRDGARLHIGWCYGCLRNGTHLDLDSGVAVERTTPEHVTEWRNDYPRKGVRTNVGPTLQRWREVPSPSTASGEATDG